MTLSVLIVDDRSAFIEAAQMLLDRDGCDVVGTASTAAEAIQLVEALSPEVALVDIHLAGESGFDVARQLHQDEHRQDTLVVLMSTHSESEFADLLDESPAVGFVAKERLSCDAIRAIVTDAR